MQILIIIGSVLAAIIVLFLVAALFAKKEYNIERDIVVNKPVREVFDYVRKLKNQDHYSKWVMTDPNMKKEFSGTDGTVGFIYAWNGNKQAGEGEQEIKAIDENNRIDIEVRFLRPFKAIAQTPMTTAETAPGQTTVRWGMISKTPYPVNLFSAMMMGVLKRDLDISLGNLKRILENK